MSYHQNSVFRFSLYEKKNVRWIVGIHRKKKFVFSCFFPPPCVYQTIVTVRIGNLHLLFSDFVFFFCVFIFLMEFYTSFLNLEELIKEFLSKKASLVVSFFERGCLKNILQNGLQTTLLFPHFFFLLILLPPLAAFFFFFHIATKSQPDCGISQRKQF